MQKDASKKEEIVFSHGFIIKFRAVLKKIYSYEEYMDFFIIPSLSGRKTLSYLPILNYTDRTQDSIEDLFELAKENRYQIRILNFSYKNFLPSDTVTMRLDLRGSNSEEIFKTSVKSRCRNKIKNSIKKYGYIFKFGNDKKNIDDFYSIYSKAMHRHGTPALGKKLFFYLNEEFKDDILFFNAYEGDTVIASMCVIIDSQIAWYPWGGVDMHYNRDLAGYFIYWKVLEYICDNTNVKIFDFGRSSYGGGTYGFKSQFGAHPVKIDILASQQEDIYSKYSLASKIWKKIPKRAVDYMGPKLCKYLVDL
jgi:lipid II:glycine glycyltransferase (peptidoglycan interpeptide bridge formation enzyme)